MRSEIVRRREWTIWSETPSRDFCSEAVPSLLVQVYAWNEPTLARSVFPQNLLYRRPQFTFSLAVTTRVRESIAGPCSPQIVRMYKRMAEAGFLAKEPGMGAADIAKAHERSAYRRAHKSIPRFHETAPTIKLSHASCLNLRPPRRPNSTPTQNPNGTLYLFSVICLLYATKPQVPEAPPRGEALPARHSRPWGSQVGVTGEDPSGARRF